MTKKLKLRSRKPTTMNQLLQIKKDVSLRQRLRSFLILLLSLSILTKRYLLESFSLIVLMLLKSRDSQFYRDRIPMATKIFSSLWTLTPKRGLLHSLIVVLVWTEMKSLRIWVLLQDLAHKLSCSQSKRILQLLSQLLDSSVLVSTLVSSFQTVLRCTQRVNQVIQVCVGCLMELVLTRSPMWITLTSKEVQRL